MNISFPTCAVRLVGSNLTNEGILEVYYDGQWGNVCDQGFDETAAGVVCRQLGFTSGNVVDAANYVTEEVKFSLDEVSCDGSEKMLGTCPHNGWGIHDCFSYEAVALTCE